MARWTLLKYAPAGWLLGAVGWLFLAWMAVDMSHPVAHLTMPASANWSGPNLVAIWTMWALMMAAMMLPSAASMIVTLVKLGARLGTPARGNSFVAGYLLVWFVFSTTATGAQWAFQALGLLNPMIVSTSTVLTALLLLIAGAYQFSPLKRACLARCRSPVSFLLGEWRTGVAGFFIMGLRLGVFCVGCCWAVMGLLFVGGVMNLAWIAALSIAVAVEKLARHGERVGTALGLALIAAGLARLLTGVAS